MNLRMYYDKVHEMEGKIDEDCLFIVSEETPDGGRAGQMTEVPRRIAAKMIVEGQARPAEPGEVASFRKAQTEAREAAERAAAAARVQFTVVPASEIERIKSPGKTKA